MVYTKRYTHTHTHTHTHTQAIAASDRAERESRVDFRAMGAVAAKALTSRARKLVFFFFQSQSSGLEEITRERERER